MPPTKPATIARIDDENTAAATDYSLMLPYLPADVSPAKARAFGDMVFGFSAARAAQRNGLSVQQCERIRTSHRAELVAAKACRQEIMACMVESLVYALVDTGLSALTHIDPTQPLTPHALSALANAAQGFARLARELPDRPEKLPPSVAHDARAALAELEGIQDVVVDTDPRP